MLTMKILSRNTVLALLILLQLFAPLVHAHVHEHFASQGLHLPGLESHVLAHEIPVLQAVHCDFDTNNLMVSVNTGIKDQKFEKVVDTEQDNHHTIRSADFVFRVAIVLVDHNFSPHFAQPVDSIEPPPYAPRAPPLL